MWVCPNSFQFCIDLKFNLPAPCFPKYWGCRLVEQTFCAKVVVVPARTELEVLLVGGGLQGISAVATIVKWVVVVCRIWASTAVCWPKKFS